MTRQLVEAELQGFPVPICPAAPAFVPARDQWPVEHVRVKLLFATADHPAATMLVAMKGSGYHGCLRCHACGQPSGRGSSVVFSQEYRALAKEPGARPAKPRTHAEILQAATNLAAHYGQCDRDTQAQRLRWKGSVPDKWRENQRTAFEKLCPCREPGCPKPAWRIRCCTRYWAARRWSG